jgi:hypothetical protein
LRKNPPCVVDTNVPLVASLKSSVSPRCVLLCTQRLQRVMTSGCAVIDDDWRILREYGLKLSATGQPGLGDAFFKWVLTNQANPRRCKRVTITPKPDDENDFEEFPDHPDLAGFDPADRKFVAVAAACKDGPVILQAADSKWHGWAPSLAERNIEVEFLCLEESAVKYSEKMGR